MDELVRYIVNNIIDEPDCAKVEMREEDDEYVIEITADPEHIGKVIGKQGRIAKAIRTIVKAASINSQKKYRVDIL